MSVTCIYKSRIVFSNATTEAKRFVLLNQVERVDKVFCDQHMQKISLPFTVEAANVTCGITDRFGDDRVFYKHRFEYA